MRTRFIALTAILGIAALVAAPVVGAAPGVTGGSSGGSSGGGGGGGGGHGGGGGGGGGGRGGGGGGHFGGGHFVADGNRGGYVAHGNYLGHSGYIARGDYRVVGSDAAGLAHVDAALRGGHGGHIVLALGPRTGSAAKALRLDRAPPGHHPAPKPKRPHHSYYQENTEGYGQRPLFCDFVPAVPASVSRVESAFDCPGALKEGGRMRGAAIQGQ